MKPDGYRYVRSYDVQRGSLRRYALWERVDGRARRVGTAWTYTQAEQWMCRRDTLETLRPTTSHPAEVEER